MRFLVTFAGMLLVGGGSGLLLTAQAARSSMQNGSVELQLARAGAADMRAWPQAPEPASPFDRIVTLSLHRVPLRDAIDEVARQADVRIAYSHRVVPVERRVSARLRDVRVRDALARLLKGTGAMATLEPTGQILLVSDPTTAGSERSVGSINGTVRASQSGLPLENVIIRVLGTQFATVSRVDGRYAITGVPAGMHQLQARRLGYAARDTGIVVPEGGEVTVDFSLAATAVELSEVVTIGYGTALRKDVTGSVSTITAEELETKAAPTVTLSSALQGKAAGVQVISNTGMPGGGLRVRVRGTGSITANSEPLYVIDGLPAVQGSSGTDPKSNPLMSIDPSEIETIQILKDASATAIYGARGANGVVIITTKRGQRGDSRITLESSYGVQEISKKIAVLNGPEFMTLANEARANAGLSQLFRPGQIDSAQTYNYPEMMLRSAPQSSHSATLSGGDVRLRYVLSGNYAFQEGIELGSDFKRYGGRLNLDSDVSNRFRVGTSLSLTRVERNAAAVENAALGNSANGLQAAMQFAPFQAPRDASGNWVRTSPTTEQVPNPVANANELKDLNTTGRLLGNAHAEFDILPELRVRSSLGGNIQFDKIHFFGPRTILEGGTGGRAWIFSGETRDLTNDNTITYRRELGPGNVDVLGGFSVQTSYFESVRGEGANFPTDETTVFALGTGAQLVPAGSGVSEWALLSYLGRLNYNVADKYLFTVTGRRDGSSRFGKHNKWGFFPSAAVAWRLSEESFLKSRPILEDLKLRLSYGKVGNQAVDPYQSLSSLNTGFYSFGGQEIPTLSPGGAMPNPDLKWEQQTQFNAGVDAVFLRNRVTLSVDGYKSKTRDLLLSVPLPSTTGFSSQLRNIGSVENRGLELSVSTVNIEGQRFSWRSTLNVAGNRNKVTKLATQNEIFLSPRTGNFFAPSETHVVRVGEPLGTIVGFRVNGLWQAGDQCYLRNPAQNCIPGEFKVVDINGDSVINSADRTVLGHGDPKFYGGFSNTFTYGPFSLDAFVNFVQGNEVINAGKAYGEFAMGQVNERRAVLNRWTPTNTNTTIPRANANRARRLYSTLVEDGSYIRLQTLTLGYQLPARFIRGAESARVFVTGQNLWLSTDYTGFDPDVNSMGGDARFGGIDIGAYPRSRTWNVGVNVTF